MSIRIFEIQVNTLCWFVNYFQLVACKGTGEISSEVFFHWAVCDGWHQYITVLIRSQNDDKI